MAIRVLHIIGSLRLGGAQVCLKQIVENNDDPNIENYIYPLRSKKIDIPIQGNVIKHSFPNYDPRKFFAILSICKKYKIDIIHAHLHKPILGALLACFFIDIPVIVHEHGSIGIVGFQYSLYRFMLKILKSKARIFIAVSKTSANQLKQFSKIDEERITVIYNAVDTNIFTANFEKRQEIRSKFGICRDDIVIGYVGRLSYEKGPDILLDAFKLLLKKNPNYLLILVGDGNMKQSLIESTLQQSISNRIKFLGFRENVSKIMNAFDIGCIPSRQEAFGIAALEYMSMNIPIVSSDAGGLGEILIDQENALILKENTPSQIYESVLRISNDPALRKSLIDNAHEYVQQFSMPTFVERINSIYRQLSKKKND